MGKRFKFLRILLCVLIVAALTTGMAQAFVPYEPYENTEWNTAAPGVPAYEPELVLSGLEMGAGTFRDPTDIFVDTEYVLICDKGNNRIVILNRKLQFIKELKTFTNEGKEEALRSPEGVCFDGEYLYIADYGNSRVLKTDMEGRIHLVVTQPEESIYTTAFFHPKRVKVDTEGKIFVVAESVFQGVMLFGADGKFESFYGAPPVQATMELIINQFWKKILGKEQQEVMERYVPVEYTDLCLDRNNFVYTCSFYTKTNMEQIRKLNYLGDNVYPFTENFGEEHIIFDKGTTVSTSFIDVAVNDGDFVFALDYTRQRVYVFDKNGNRLTTFGAAGNQQGAFQKASAIDVDGNAVYILDSAKGNVTVYEPNSYGEMVFEAVTAYNEADYTGAKDTWQAVLDQNPNFEMAYRGLGEVYLQEKDYKTALRYFRIGYDREKESAAFAGLRSAFLREHIVLLALGLLLLIIAVILVTSPKLRKKMQKSWGKKRGGS